MIEPIMLEDAFSNHAKPGVPSGACQAGRLAGGI
jgi:hypothetical protein